MRGFFLLLAFILANAYSIAQLRIDTSLTSEEIVTKCLLQAESELIISNIRYKGKATSMAAFVNESPEVLMDKGVLFTTGSVYDGLGPNDEPNAGSKGPNQGSSLWDSQLQGIATGKVMDAVSLEFDLISLRDSISFTYVFASEEYPEYVYKGVSDIFAFFISEVGKPGVPVNIAKLPNTNTTVSIDNVNHLRNEQYFLRSDFFYAHDVNYWAKHKDLFMRARIFEYDGFTIPLRAVVKLENGKKYHLKIVIADVGDKYYDSAVMLKAHSLSASGERIPQADSIIKETIAASFNSNNGIILRKDLSFDLLIHFNHDEAIILKDSYLELNELVRLLKEFHDLKVQIIGHTDSDGTNERNIDLSERRAKAVRHFLSERGIEQFRMSTMGMGEEQAVSSNSTASGKAKNRRVEFRLTY